MPLWHQPHLYDEDPSLYPKEA